MILELIRVGLDTEITKRGPPSWQPAQYVTAGQILVLIRNVIIISQSFCGS